MGKTTVTLTLPEEVVQHFHQLAAVGHRTPEELTAEVLAAHQPEAGDYEKMLAPLTGYTDEQ